MKGLTVTRDTAAIGFPPARAIEPMTWYLHSTEENATISLLSTRLPYRYYLGYYYKQDFSDLQYKVVNQFITNPNNLLPGLYRFVTGTFPVMHPGRYKVIYHYVLPGNIQSGKYEFEFENPAK